MSAFPRSTAEFPGLRVVESSPSTNSELASLAPGLPHFSALVTESQTAGRGRLDRSWVAPAGSALAVSVLLRLDLPPERLGWVPLVAGVAMRHALLIPLGAGPTVKWPNDLLVGGRKISGILAELQPDGAIVLGAGVNTAMTAEQLPVETATSIAVEGGAADHDAIDRMLEEYLRGLSSRLDALAAGSPAIRAEVKGALGTLGGRVRVELPDGSILAGTAVDLDADGRLVVRAEDGAIRSVAAGDVTHVR